MEIFSFMQLTENIYSQEKGRNEEQTSAPKLMDQAAYP